MNFKSWIAEVATPEWFVYMKVLSANDTGATGGHQSGIYLPREVAEVVLPTLCRTDRLNPDVALPTRIDSHRLPEQTLRGIYYNNKVVLGRTRDERRLTCWRLKGRETPVQDPEQTGSVGIFAFRMPVGSDSEFLRVWVCTSAEEEELSGSFGDIDPLTTYRGSGEILLGALLPDDKGASWDYPSEWDLSFPSGAELFRFLYDSKTHIAGSPDNRLLKRRTEEYALYRQIEKAHLLPLVREGFDEVDDFVRVANSIANRRKSRAGRSLELHLEQIFREEGLQKFSSQCVTEGNKRPDFIFPSRNDYADKTFPSDKLRMLAVKTTVKDRWRQILNEAERIGSPHLFTLQQGVSENQFREMKSEGVQLVVPATIHRFFPKSVKPELISLDRFIAETKALLT